MTRFATQHGYEVDPTEYMDDDETAAENELREQELEFRRAAR